MIQHPMPSFTQCKVTSSRCKCLAMKDQTNAVFWKTMLFFLSSLCFLYLPSAFCTPKAENEWGRLSLSSFKQHSLIKTPMLHSQFCKMQEWRDIQRYLERCTCTYHDSYTSKRWRKNRHAEPAYLKMKQKLICDLNVQFTGSCSSLDPRGYLSASYL